jgi:hypothetical protein
MNTQTQIAQILNVTPADILEIREWAWVYWVHVSGKRPTMVSKQAMIAAPKVYTLITYGIRAEFEILPHCAKIAYTDSQQTQYEVTTITIARRRWMTLKSRGFMQAA